MDIKLHKLAPHDSRHPPLHPDRPQKRRDLGPGTRGGLNHHL